MAVPPPYRPLHPLLPRSNPSPYQYWSPPWPWWLARASRGRKHRRRRPFQPDRARPDRALWRRFLGRWAALRPPMPAAVHTPRGDVFVELLAPEEREAEAELSQRAQFLSLIYVSPWPNEGVIRTSSSHNALAPGDSRCNNQIMPMGDDFRGGWRGRTVYFDRNPQFSPPRLWSGQADLQPILQFTTN